MRKIGSWICLSLTIAVVGSVQRTGPGAKTTLPSSKDTAQIAAARALFSEAYQVFQSGEYLQAEELYRVAYQNALRNGRPDWAARFLTGVGNCRFATYRYRDALDTYLEARRISEAAADRANLGSLYGNISSLYLLMGDLDAAVSSAERSLADFDPHDFPGGKSRCLIQLAMVRARQGRVADRDALMSEAVDTGYREGDLAAVAEAWDHWGEEFLEKGELAQADWALTEGFRLRKLHGLRKLDSSYLNLGKLRLAQGDSQSAASLLAELMARQKHPDSLAALWKIHHALGQARLAQGRVADAFSEFRTALDLARTWRLGVLPSDSTRVGSEGNLQQIYSSFIEAGNRLYFSIKKTELVRDTFRAAEENRAASLRALLAMPSDWRRALPPRYWEALAQLHSAEVALLREDHPALREKIQHLRATILELEAKAGWTGEIASQRLTGRVENSLTGDQVLLSFHLGEQHSYLWAVSRERFRLYVLPPKPELAGDMARLSDAVRTDSPSARTLGRALYEKLFGQLDAPFRDNPRWILALDEQLFQVPFGALVVEVRGASPVYLIQRHSVRIGTGAIAMAESRAKPWSEQLAGGFLGIGDAIYNTADPRWKPLAEPWWSVLPVASAATSLGETRGPALTRLVGSAQEIESCARAWRSRDGGAVLLEGADASPERLQHALAARPSVIHFAAHFLQAKQSPQYGMIALSLASSGESQLLSPLEIARSEIQTALVVLSGCSSGRAAALPASGLMGLTRAWLAAGARAVVASHWPTPDDTGTLFVNFYRHFREAPDAGPAAALQKAQLDLLRAGGWRANPQYWATYFVAGDS